MACTCSPSTPRRWCCPRTSRPPRCRSSQQCLRRDEVSSYKLYTTGIIRSFVNCDVVHCQKGCHLSLTLKLRLIPLALRSTHSDTRPRCGPSGWRSRCSAGTASPPSSPPRWSSGNIATRPRWGDTVTSSHWSTIFQSFISKTSHRFEKEKPLWTESTTHLSEHELKNKTAKV